MFPRLIALTLLLFILSTSAPLAKKFHHPLRQTTDNRAEQGIDEKINSLRAYSDSHFVSRSEFDVVNNLEVDINKLIDDGQKRDAQLTHLSDTIGHTLDNFHAEVAQLGSLQETNTKASQNITVGLGDIRGSLANPPSPHFLSFPSISSLLPAILGALFGAGVTSLVVLHVAKRYTKQMRMYESTLEFSKRFGELIKEQSELNNKYVETRSTDQMQNTLPTPREANDAKTWWSRFFDLMVYEYDFFMEGLLWDERFAEWMRWRWHEYNAQGDDIWKTCGIDYRQGWKIWKDRPANINNRLIAFFETIHNLKNADEVEKYVMSQSPRRPNEYSLVRSV